MATPQDREREMKQQVDRYLEPKCIALRDACGKWVASTGQLPAGATAPSVVASLVKEHFALSLPRIDDDAEVGYGEGAMGIYLRLPVAGDLALVQQVTDLAPQTCALSSEEKVMKVRVDITDMNSDQLKREIANAKSLVGDFLAEVADAARDTQARAGNMIAIDITAHVKSLTRAPSLESAMLKLGVKKVDPKKN